MVLAAVIDCVMWTSNHFECVSTSSKNMCPKRDQQSPNVFCSMVEMAIPRNVEEQQQVLVTIPDKQNMTS